MEDCNEGDFLNDVVSEVPTTALDYVFDISNFPSYRFVPVIDDVMQPEASSNAKRCPGRLVGLYHSKGDLFERQFMVKNPAWHEEYRREVPKRKR